MHSQKKTIKDVYLTASVFLLDYNTVYPLAYLRGQFIIRTKRMDAPRTNIILLLLSLHNYHPSTFHHVEFVVNGKLTPNSAKDNSEPKNSYHSELPPGLFPPKAFSSLFG